MDTDEGYYTVRLESLPVHVRIGRPAIVEMDEEDDHVIHLHPGALYQKLYLPGVLFLACPAERRGSWFRQTGDDSVYGYPCGARWDIFPEDWQEMDGM